MTDHFVCQDKMHILGAQMDAMLILLNDAGPHSLFTMFAVRPHNKHLAADRRKIMEEPKYQERMAKNLTLPSHPLR